MNTVLTDTQKKCKRVSIPEDVYTHAETMAVYEGVTATALIEQLILREFEKFKEEVAKHNLKTTEEIKAIWGIPTED